MIEDVLMFAQFMPRFAFANGFFSEKQFVCSAIYFAYFNSYWACTAAASRYCYSGPVFASLIVSLSVPLAYCLPFSPAMKSVKSAQVAFVG
jgi:hypothetical protein